ncbi:MAG: hypothetical protein U0271_37555 [Polyangiaceae bacterium]
MRRLTPIVPPLGAIPKFPSETGLTKPVLLDSSGDITSPSIMDAMKGTNFIAGLRWLRGEGLDEAYLDGLTPSVRATITSIAAGDWIPLETCLVHYAALDALALSFERRIGFGADVSRFLNGLVLGTIARLAGKVGVSPLMPLSRAAGMFARSFRGGAIATYQLGPRSAMFEVQGCKFAVSPCHRDNVHGALIDGARPFAEEVRVVEITSKRTPTSYAFRFDW